MPIGFRSRGIPFQHGVTNGRRTLPIVLFLCLSCSFAITPHTSAGPPGDEPPREALRSSETEHLRKLMDEFHYEEVIDEARRMLAAAGDDPLRRGEILEWMVQAYWRGGHATDPEARELAERALRLKREALGDGHLELADSYMDYGNVLTRTNDLEGAREAYERAVTIREANLGPDEIEVARALDNLADLLQKLGEYDEALSRYERALRIGEQVLGPDDYQVGSTLHDMGNLLLRMGDYGRSRLAYERALHIEESVLGPDHPDVAMTLISMGYLMQLTGDLEEGRARLKRAVAITEAKLGADHPLTATAVNNLGGILYELGDYAAARPLYERTLAARIARQGPDHVEVAEASFNLGMSLRALGDLDGALGHIDRALSIAERNHGPVHPEVAEYLVGLGDVELARGEQAMALSRYRRALNIRLQSLGQGHPLTASARLRLAGILLLLDERAEALEHAALATGVLDRHARDTVAYLPERKAMLLVSAGKGPEGVLFEGLLSSEKDGGDWLETCWDWALRRRALVQDELARRNRNVLGKTTGEAGRLWKEVTAARRKISDLWVEGPGDSADAFEARLRNARAREESLESDLARLSIEFRREHVDRTADLDAVRRALPTSDALLEIVRVPVGPPTDDDRPDHYVALILGPSEGRPKRTTAFRDLGIAGAIDDAVARWREELRSAIRAAGAVDQGGVDDAEENGIGLDVVQQAGRRLRRLIWDPVAPALDHARVVFVVPDGSLHRVDLRALSLDDGRFLIESSPVFHLLDSSRDLVRLTDGSIRQPVAAGGLLALGAPDFDAAGPARLAALRSDESEQGGGGAGRAFRGRLADCADLRVDWPALPQTGREIEAVASLLAPKQKVLVLTGSEASEERFKSAASGRSVLHLATHGFFLEEGCAARASAENPLLLSGVVLAGANRADEAFTDGRLEDGILTAEEFATIDLRGLALAVLSGCDTGRGEIAVGEGVFGLRRALALAGARTVVMSLWPIPDVETRHWMTRFYRGISAGTPIVDAVQDSTLQALDGLRADGIAPHPYLWAGFVAAGDWR